MVTGQDINDFNVLFYYLRRFYSLVRRDFCIFEEVDSLGPPPVLDTMDEEDELHEICHNGEVDELRQFIRDAPAGYDFNQYEVSVVVCCRVLLRVVTNLLRVERELSFHNMLL